MVGEGVWITYCRPFTLVLSVNATLRTANHIWSISQCNFSCHEVNHVTVVVLSVDCFSKFRRFNFSISISFYSMGRKLRRYLHSGWFLEAL